MRDPCDDGNALFLDCININTLGYYFIVLEDVTFGGKLVKGTKDLSVLLLNIARESIIISK